MKVSPPRPKTARAAVLAYALLLSLSLVVCAPPLVGVSGAAHAGSGTAAEESRTPSHSAGEPSAPARGARTAASDERALRSAREAYANLPLRFEANRGQTDARVKFLSRGPGYQLFLTAREAVLSLRDGAGAAPSVVRMRLRGANPSPRVEGSDELGGATNYFAGRDRSKWRAGVEGFARVRYGAVYPGVDMVFYGSQRQLEYDFHLSPHARPEQIRLAFEGVSRLEVNAAGDLLLHTAAGREVRQHKPVLYQEVDGLRREVAGGYVVKGAREVGFAVGEYDASRPLVIDPVLSYSTYVGGGSDESLLDIAVDAAGNAYLTGVTTSVDFPTANPVQLPPPGKLNECFVTKLNAAGTAVVYSTYIGGSSYDNGLKISVDAAGQAYVMGNTSSTDFPLVNAVQTQLKGTTDVFVLKLNAQGSALVYSTYLGGSPLLDTGTDLAIDNAGHAYVTGYTYNTNFPVTEGAYQTTKNGLYTNLFVSKIAPAGSRLVYSTYVGAGGEYAPSIGVDAAGRACITAQAGVGNFPTTPGALQPTRPESQVGGDVIVAKLNAAGSGLVYGTYLAGPARDIPSGIAVDPDGSAYVLGGTSSGAGFPTTTFIPESATAKDNVFVTKLNPQGSAVVYSTQINFPNNGNLVDITTDAQGNAYATGMAYSGAPTTAGAIQTTPAGQNDAYLLKLNPNGTSILYATFFGGNNGDNGRGVALDSAGNIYVGGYTDSTKLPVVPGSLRTRYSGGSEGFVFKLSDGAPLSYTVSGRVADPSGRGLAGVTLTLTGAEGSTQTDADGHYSFTLPAYGSYVLTPAKEGYTFNAYSLSFENLNSNQTGDFTGTAAAASYTINGRVRGPDFFSVRVEELRLTGSVTGTTQNTWQGGGFAFRNLAPGGTYTITPVLPGYSFQPASVTFSNLAGDKAESEATFVATKVSSIYSIVTGSNNNGLGGIKLTVTNGEGTIHTLSTNEQLTNGQGIAALLQLPRGQTYRITPSGPGLTFTPSSLTFENLSNDPGGKFVVTADASPTPTPSPTPNSVPPGSSGEASFPIFGVNTANELVVFYSNAPSTVVSRKPITGLPNGSSVQGLDVRPSTGQLYALVRRPFTETLPNLNIYVIDPATGAASIVNGPAFGTLSAITYGFDFNPVTDLIRVVSDAGDNLRVNPDTGAVTTDTPLAYAGGDANAGRKPAIAGAAYTNNFAGATSTTLYDIDYGNNIPTSDLLVRQGSVGGSPVSPDTGQLFTVGALNFSTLEFVGFDVAPGTAETAFAAMFFQDGPSQLFRVNLSTGAATQLGFTNGAGTLVDIAVAPQSVAGNTLQFDAAKYSVTEDCTARTVTVTRGGLATSEVTVEYTTADGTAKEKSDYEFAAGRLTFAPGETSKTFQILVNEDVYSEGTETATLTLSNPTGGAVLTAPSVATLEILDDGDTGTEANPINDAANFVCQHYHDFLNREPDAPGLAFWTNQITECETRPVEQRQACREIRRINVSAAFFLSPEFQQTGFLVYRFHQAAFNTGEHLDIHTFLADTQAIGRGVVIGQPGAEARLEANKQAFAEEFAARPAFLEKYPLTMSNAAFVDALNANTGGSLSASERNDLVNRLDSGAITRGQALRAVAEDADFRQREFSRAFVLIEYFGYLRRNPDDPGFQFWLNKLNAFGGNYITAEMVKAFITSGEYKQRFAPN